jgi:hypothetical protein
MDALVGGGLPAEERSDVGSCSLAAKSRNETGGIPAADRLQFGGGQTSVLQRLELTLAEIGIVAAVGDLRRGHELGQSRHRRRTGRVCCIVIEPPQFTENPLGRELLQVRTFPVEGVDPTGHHRNCSAGVREQPPDFAPSCKTAREQEAGDASRGVVWNLNDRRKRADAEGAATVGNEGMNVYDSAPPIELVEHRFVFAIAQPLVPVARLEADAVRLQGVERIFNFLERSVDVDHRQRREQVKAAGLLAHPIGRIIIAVTGHLAGPLGIEIEPDPGVDAIDNTAVRMPASSIASIALPLDQAT